MNKVILMGRLTRDPEVRYTQNNMPVASFTLAVKKKAAEGTDFINCVAWNKTGEFVNKYFKKGQQIAITGRINTRSYEDSQGSKKYITEVVVEEVFFTGSKEKQSENNEFIPNFSQNNDDLPF